MEFFKVTDETHNKLVRDYVLKKNWKRVPNESIWREFISLISDPCVLNLISIFGNLFYRSRSDDMLKIVGRNGKIIRSREEQFLYKELIRLLDERR